MKSNAAQSTWTLPMRMMLIRGVRGLKWSVQVALVQSVLLLLAGPAHAAATGTKQREYPHDFEAVWAATIGALQGHGDPIVYSDKPGGIITTGFKAEEDEEWHHKFNLLFVRNGEEATNISVTCNVESLGNHGLTWKDQKSDGSRETQLLEAITRRLQPSGAAEDVSESNCRANFAVKGSIVRGTTFSSFDEFPALDQATAVDALIASLLHEALSLVNTDKSNGTISATGRSSSGRPYPLDSCVVPMSGGFRVSFVLDLPCVVQPHRAPVRARRPARPYPGCWFGRPPWSRLEDASETRWSVSRRRVLSRCAQFRAARNTARVAGYCRTDPGCSAAP